MRTLDRGMGALVVVQPPAELDVLVRKRVSAVLEQRRAENARRTALPANGGRNATGGPERKGAAPKPRAIPVQVALGERCVYAAGIAVYGAQLAAETFRRVWMLLAQ